MSEKKLLKPVALAVGVALAGAFAIGGSVNAASVDSPFQMSALSAGYMLGEGEGSCGGDDKKDGEGSCGGDDKKDGEGSWGGDHKKDAEGSCGEGSCGADKKDAEGSCGGDDKKDDGEGSCGGML